LKTTATFISIALKVSRHQRHLVLVVEGVYIVTACEQQLEFFRFAGANGFDQF
jgi:hypothetical protein